jgi:hypothetical protein
LIELDGADHARERAVSRSLHQHLSVRRALPALTIGGGELR